MRLFHTSDRIIREPDIYAGRRNADFGQGFYLSVEESFGGNWARERTSSDIYINVYELDLAGVCKPKESGLKVKTFSRDAEWYRFIFNNRRGIRPDEMAGFDGYDVIIGPVANDTLFETYGIITSGLLTEDQALELLSAGPEYTQTVIKTEAGLAALKWVDAYLLDEGMIRAARERYEADRQSFEEQFTASLESFSG